MKILKKICALALTGCLFLCGSGFSNKYEDVQIIELKSNPSTGFVWNVEVVNLKSQEDDEKDNIEDEYIEDKKKDGNENEEEEKDDKKENKMEIEEDSENIEDIIDMEEKKDDMRKKHIFKTGEVEISRDFISDNEDPAICGAGGTDIFTIRGKEEGFVILSLEYKRCGNEECDKDDCDPTCAKEVVFVVVRVNEEKKVKIVGYVDIDVDEIREQIKFPECTEKDKKIFLSQARLI
ncbi:MAG: protease inhibitor I42 family protein [Firmicutes bacterium]|nr:protease inhibitor I42 family protein [Bacillota bacterium]